MFYIYTFILFIMSLKTNINILRNYTQVFKYILHFNYVLQSQYFIIYFFLLRLKFRLTEIDNLIAKSYKNKDENYVFIKLKDNVNIFH